MHRAKASVSKADIFSFVPPCDLCVVYVRRYYPPAISVTAARSSLYKCLFSGRPMVAPTLETRLSSKIRQKSNVINLDRQKTAIKVKFRDSGCVDFGFTVEFTL